VALKDDQPRRPTRYRALSWSWASVEGTVAFSGPFDTKDIVAEVIQCEVLLVDPNNQFGAVPGVHLVVKEPLRSLDANAILEYSHVNSTDARELSLARIYLDRDEILPSSITLSMPSDISGSDQTCQRIWLLDMVQDKYGDPSGYLLRQFSQQNNRMFRRIGWFDTTTGSRDTAFRTRDTSMETITVV
jgi:hypothetical protein